MRTWIKTTKLALLFTLCAQTMPLQADDCEDDCEGDCYQESCYCKLAPEWAIGGLAVVAIAAVLLQNNSHSH